MISRALDLLLGTERKQRLRLVRTLSAAGVFSVCLLLQLAAVLLGLVDLPNALGLCGFVVVGQLMFYVALRSGWSLRFMDPALTMPQMVFAIVALALAYAINPLVRGMMTMILALVLVFGAFILPQRHCRQLGWFAVVALGIVMSVSVSRAPQLFDPLIEAFQFLLSALVLPMIGSLAGQLSRIRTKQDAQKTELRDALEKVRLLATHDELTGLPNRRQVLELFAHEERRALRQDVPLCSCLIDIDYFKQINDTLGHQAGDDALKRFSSILKDGLRAGDVLSRWGGEEFMLLLPGTPLDEALQVVERLRQRCADSQRWADVPQLQVAFSAGLCAHQVGESAQQAIARADAALYKAKELGRNRVVVA